MRYLKVFLFTIACTLFIFNATAQGLLQEPGLMFPINTSPDALKNQIDIGYCNMIGNNTLVQGGLAAFRYRLQKKNDWHFAWIFGGGIAFETGHVASYLPPNITYLPSIWGNAVTTPISPIGNSTYQNTVLSLDLFNINIPIIRTKKFFLTLVTGAPLQWWVKKTSTNFSPAITQYNPNSGKNEKDSVNLGDFTGMKSQLYLGFQAAIPMGKLKLAPYAFMRWITMSNKWDMPATSSNTMVFQLGADFIFTRKNGKSRALE